MVSGRQFALMRPALSRTVGSAAVAAGTLRTGACEQRRDPNDMSPHDRSASARIATAFTALAFYALWIRPQMLTWGATPDETTVPTLATNWSRILTAGRRWPRFFRRRQRGSGPGWCRWEGTAQVGIAGTGWITTENRVRTASSTAGRTSKWDGI